MALAAAVCAVVPPAIDSRPMCGRISMSDTRRVGTVDPEACFRPDVPRWTYQDMIPVAALRHRAVLHWPRLRDVHTFLR